MSEQHVELSLVKIELLSKMLLHYMTPNSNTHLRIIVALAIITYWR